jgi:hypothetical protein
MWQIHPRFVAFALTASVLLGTGTTGLVAAPPSKWRAYSGYRDSYQVDYRVPNYSTPIGGGSYHVPREGGLLPLGGTSPHSTPIGGGSYHAPREWDRLPLGGTSPHSTPIGGGSYHAPHEWDRLPLGGKSPYMTPIGGGSYHVSRDRGVLPRRARSSSWTTPVGRSSAATQLFYSGMPR